MGFRFRRRVRISPGVSLNVSKSGLGLSVGPRGMKVGVGPRGSYYSVGAPGTGLHYRKEMRGGASRRSPGGTPLDLPREVKLALQTDGSVALLDDDDRVLPLRTAKLVRDAYGAEIQQFLEAECARIDGGIAAILRVHHSTPAPDARLRYERVAFATSEPTATPPRQYGILDRLIPGRRARIDAENLERHEAYLRARSRWTEQKRDHEEAEARRAREFDDASTGDEANMERILGERLGALEWPRETSLSFQLDDGGTSVLMDVDLPEVHDMPADIATVAARGLKLNIKRKSETQIRKEYMQFIHGIMFRAIGEAFFVLPNLQHVTASGYSQRPDPATGNVRDEYLLSVRVSRSAWSEINFSNLEALDVVASFERFELCRRMSKTGVFQPIEPFAIG